MFAKEPKFLAKEAFSTVYPDTLRLYGQTGQLADRVAAHWLIGLRESNPAILAMFRSRDVQPYRDLLPWSGEFAGKHLTGAYYVSQLTRSQALYDDITAFLDELIACQDTDGYLGCFSSECRLTGAFSQNPYAQGCTWDAWNHYHIMMGLLLWYGLTGREAYREALLKIAELFLRKFYYGKPTLASIGSTEMNLAPYHIFALLYELTGEEKYLYFAKKIEGDLTLDVAGDYLRCSLRGVEFYQCPKPRWESLHIILGIAEMYAATGEMQYLRSAMQITNSILKTDVHNTGAFSTNEQAIGNPYTNDKIETCCTVAFNALCVRVASLTGSSDLYDFLELSHYNAACGSVSPSGRWSTYNTPMDGEKRANVDSIQFQCRPGSPFLNCCSVNAPRGIAEIADYQFTEREGVLCLNFFEAYEAAFGGLRVVCESRYPAPGPIRIRVSGNGIRRPLAVRVPGWSAHTTLTTGGETVSVPAGTWAPLGEVWNGTAEFLLELDFTPRIENGDLEYKDKCSIYCGPVLYGADVSHNPSQELPGLPPIRLSQLTGTRPEPDADGSIRWRTGGVTLTDFYHIGSDGSAYRTWLDVVRDE